MAPLADSDVAESVEVENPDLSPSQKASQGTSLQAYNDALELEKLHPELVKPFPSNVPVEAKTASEQPRRSRREREQDAANERTQKAVAAATADLRKQIETLKAAPRETRPAESVREPVRERPAAAATQSDADRYLALPDAPKVADFQAAGKSYEQFSAAQNLFILDKWDAERAERSASERQDASRLDQERSRAGKFKTALDADPDLTALFKVVQETGQWPENAAVSRDVLSLQTFYQLELDNAARKAKGLAERPASALNAIAEELVSSAHQVALVKHLSKPGELARLAALPDARSLIREMNRIELELSTPKPVKTKTSAGEPAVTLTSARATDPLDDEESAIRRGNQADYTRIANERELRKRGLLR